MVCDFFNPVAKKKNHWMRYIGDYDNPIFINLDMNMMNIG